MQKNTNWMDYITFQTAFKFSTRHISIYSICPSVLWCLGRNRRTKESRPLSRAAMAARCSHKKHFLRVHKTQAPAKPSVTAAWNASIHFRTKFFLLPQQSVLTKQWTYTINYDTSTCKHPLFYTEMAAMGAEVQSTGHKCCKEKEAPTAAAACPVLLSFCPPTPMPKLFLGLAPPSVPLHCWADCRMNSTDNNLSTKRGRKSKDSFAVV